MGCLSRRNNWDWPEETLYLISSINKNLKLFVGSLESVLFIRAWFLKCTNDDSACPKVLSTSLCWNGDEASRLVSSRSVFRVRRSLPEVTSFGAQRFNVDLRVWPEGLIHAIRGKYADRQDTWLKNLCLIYSIQRRVKFDSVYQIIVKNPSSSRANQRSFSSGIFPGGWTTARQSAVILRNNRR